MRGRWAPPPTEGEGPREGQRMGIGQWAPPAADENTLRRRHANPPPTLSSTCRLGPPLDPLDAFGGGEGGGGQIRAVLDPPLFFGVLWSLEFRLLLRVLFRGRPSRTPPPPQPTAGVKRLLAVTGRFCISWCDARWSGAVGRLRRSCGHAHAVTTDRPGDGRAAGGSFRN